MDIKLFLSEHFDIIERFFTSSRKLVMILLNKELEITEYSAGFAELFCKTGDKNICTQNIKSLLLPENHGILPLPEASTHLITRLNFLLKDSDVVTLDCQIFKIADRRHLIIGEHIVFTNDQVLREITALTNELVTMNRDLLRKNRELEQAHSKIKTLSGIIPICSFCKKIKNDKGYWKKLESFISEHSEAEFSHSICDQCLQDRYPDDQEQ